MYSSILQFIIINIVVTNKNSGKSFKLRFRLDYNILSRKRVSVVATKKKKRKKKIRNARLFSNSDVSEVSG